MHCRKKFQHCVKLANKNMKNYLIAAIVASFCFSCEKKSTTINEPPNTIEKKTETETKTTPGGTTTEKKETTEKR
jgi:hypothetical protein